jgi:hypothetical protein
MQPSDGGVARGLAAARVCRLERGVTDPGPDPGDQSRDLLIRGVVGST